MKKSFSDYEEAYKAGRELSKQCKTDVALRKCDEFGRTVYNINLLPAKEFRFGRDLEGEVITY